MRNLTPAEVVGWLRDNAAKFSRMANDIESTFGLLNQQTLATSPKTITPEQIECVMAGRSLRSKTIADELNASEHIVNSILESESRFVQGKQGWWRLADKAKPDKQILEGGDHAA